MNLSNVFLVPLPNFSLSFFIIIIIIIIIILDISFMQGIYTYIPETNHVPREHCIIIVIIIIIIIIK